MEILSPKNSLSRSEYHESLSLIRNSFGSINKVICDDLVKPNKRVLLKLQETTEGYQTKCF
jgi:hypothetical protein